MPSRPPPAVRNAKRNRQPKWLHLEFAPEPGVVYVVSRDNIEATEGLHTFDPGARSSTTPGAAGADGDGPIHMRICPAYNCPDPKDKCQQGNRCGDVHALLSMAKKLVPHRRPVGGGWPPGSREAVPYALMPAGDTRTVKVAMPNGVKKGEMVPVNQLLRTQAPCCRGAVAAPVAPVGLEADGPPLQLSTTVHCAHWLQRSVCNFGEQCSFVHHAWPTAEMVQSSRVGGGGARDGGGGKVPAAVVAVPTPPPTIGDPPLPPVETATTTMGVLPTPPPSVDHLAVLSPNVVAAEIPRPPAAIGVDSDVVGSDGAVATTNPPPSSLKPPPPAGL